MMHYDEYGDPDLVPPDACTDLGNARHLYEYARHEAMYVGTWKQWYVWKGTRWTKDSLDKIGGLAQESVLVLSGRAKRALDAATLALNGTTGVNLVKPGGGINKQALLNFTRAGGTINPATIARYNSALAWTKWAKQSQNTERIKALIVEAARNSSWTVDHGELDRHPMLLTCRNGTVDLETGFLRPARQQDLMTKFTDVHYDRHAQCPTWDMFLHVSMGGNDNLVRYLQRIAGYCLTGRIDEHILGFFFGGGANGKSTFLTALKEVMGEYACQGPRGLLFWAKNERHPTEFARLFKQRLVVCSEVDEGAKLDEARVKDLSGGEQISARRMREDFWEFDPTHKLIIAGNHWFFVRGQDEGIWRRIRVVPWLVTVPDADRDHQLQDKLRAEYKGILRWCVEGALAWQREGLDEPAEVRLATAQFREASDPVERWLESETIREETAKIPADTLFNSYRMWCVEQGVDCLPPRKFTTRMRMKGYMSKAIRIGDKVVYGWKCIRLVTAEERAAKAWGTEVSDK